MIGDISRLLCVCCLVYVASSVHADVLHMPAGLTSLETVRVGDAGNSPDRRYSSTGYGSVSYEYSIGKYEVTAGQYCDFLNNKAKADPYMLYDSKMASGGPYYMACNIQRSGSSGSYRYSVATDWANRPVNFVSFWSACRFANWLGNGQGNGDTEVGAYTLNGFTGIGGNTITRNAGWTWAVASEDEWYKAAYYKSEGTNAGYWDFATQSNTAPANQVLPSDPGNSACYHAGSSSIGGPYYRTSAGEFENSQSAYGTFDQAGNVSEWNEAVRLDSPDRTYRGGSWDSGLPGLLASCQSTHAPSASVHYIGFRVVAAVPEPSSVLVLLSGISGFGGVVWRRRSA